MLKIVVAGWYPPDAEHIAGGPHYNAYMQAQTLKEREDVEVAVVSRNREVNEPTIVDSNGVPVHFVPEPRQRFVPRQFTMPGKVAPFIAALNPDVVVAHNSTEALAAVRAAVPTAYVVHGIPKHEARFASGIERLSRWLQVRMETRALRAVKDVVCISDYCMQACRADTHSRLHKISYPIVEDAFFQVPAYDSGRAVLFAGAINPMKNVGTLVRAWPSIVRRFPDAVLRVCGRATDAEYESELHHFIAENGLTHAVEFLGVISRTEIASRLRDSVCLSLPSRQEDTPNVVAQSLSAARAAVASTVGGIPEMVDDGHTGFLLDPDDVQGFADRICELMDNPAAARNMGLAGREHAVKTFERHAHIKELLAICEKVISAAHSQQ